MDHPSEETLRRFAAGTATREENRAVVSHLVKGCKECGRKLRALMEPESVSAVDYEAALDRFDRELMETLQSSIPPARTPGVLLRGVFPGPARRELRRERGLRKKG